MAIVARRWLASLLVLLLLCPSKLHADYLVGAGKADITGPVADVNLMGYAMPLQIARGLHIRLYARAFVFAESSNNRQRFVYVVADACMSSQLVTLRVLQRLEALYGGLYSKDNVLLSGTHTHASPAGFLQYVLYSVTSLGFVRQSFDALVDGTTEAIVAAHEDLAPAAVSHASGQLLGANVNRSPTAYLADPADERAAYEFDVDKDMQLLRIQAPSPRAAAAPPASIPATGCGAAAAAGQTAGSEQVAAAGTPSPGAGSRQGSTGGSTGGSSSRDNRQGRGMISWFSVHCTSMNNTNPYVSGDNKGAAAQLVEKAWDKQHSVRDAGKISSSSGSGSSSSSSSSSPSSGSRQLGRPSRFRACRRTTADSLSWLIRHLQLLKCLLFTRPPTARAAPAAACATAAAASPAGPAGFVAAFAQSSVGDASPNVQGAFCLDTGLPCEMNSSTCSGRNELCHGRGPAWPDDSASTAAIADLQADKAQQLWQAAGSQVSGPIDFRHTYVNMSGVAVRASRWTRAGVTCPPAMGFSFAAGTTDGPGAFDFIQGDTTGNPFWNLVRDFLSPPSQQQQACQAPKPILLNTGAIKQPYPWQPDVTEASVMRLGNFVMVGVPGEFTTMAGRRMRAAVAGTIGGAWGAGLQVVVSGLSGTYSSYITTWEEYQVQRYEGASTLYGPHTLDAYIQTVLELLQVWLSPQQHKAWRHLSGSAGADL
ncbi:neutral ceramidase [Scenedesmus sp. NREL 46B-D3]|nr:neutral ceramidase [Scenedesmus sp. NREL 46B-D3]